MSRVKSRDNVIVTVCISLGEFLTKQSVSAALHLSPVLHYFSHYLAFLPGLLLFAPARGGVTGRPLLRPPYWYFAFLSAGFRI